MLGLNRYSNSMVVLVGGAVFMLLAVHNGYPIVTADTGTYISSGFELHAPIDRPIFYGLFIRASSLGLSLWLTVFAQSLLLSYVYLKLINSLIPGISTAHKIWFLLFASLCTIGGWYASQLMPDIFVPIMIMAILVFLTDKKATKWSTNVALVICLIATITHNSNYITLTLFSIILLVSSFAIRRFSHLRKKALKLLATSIVAWLILCSSNWLERKEFTPSSATHVFLMGKLVESGVLRTYLDKACPLYGYSICKHKDSLPAAAWGFVWDESSPLQKMGGWQKNREEYNAIIGDVLSRPKYWPFLLFKSGEATFRQLVLINIDGIFELPWVKYLNGSSPYQSVDRYFPHETNELILSKENNGGLSIQFMNRVFGVFFVASGLMVLLLSRRGSLTEVVNIMMLMIGLIILNAFTTATFANVLTRLNSRVIWLMPALNMVYLYKYAASTLAKRSEQRM